MKHLVICLNLIFCCCISNIIIGQTIKTKRAVTGVLILNGPSKDVIISADSVNFTPTTTGTTIDLNGNIGYQTAYGNDVNVESIIDVENNNCGKGTSYICGKVTLILTNPGGSTTVLCQGSSTRCVKIITTATIAK